MSWEIDWEVDSNASEKSGNQGVVRRVVNRSTGEIGALKLMRKEDARRTERLTRFENEAEALRRLTVSGVPKVLAAGRSANGIPYLISRWIEGRTLTQTVNGKGMSLHDSVSITRQLVVLLSEIHKNGVVHRDIKPDNLMVDENQRLWLVDFGLSWLEGPEDTQLTVRAGSRIGNHFLVLPESIQEGAQREPRSDLTLAVGVFFYLLTGFKPAQLRDSLLRPPHKTPSAQEIFSSIDSASTINAINSLFDVGFAQTLTHRLQSSEDFLVRLENISQPKITQGSSSSERIAASLQKYQSTRQLIDAAIDEIENNMVSSVRQIAAAVRDIARANDFDGPLDNAGVTAPGREVSVLWQMKRTGHHDPYIFYKIRACLTGQDRSLVELRLTASHAETSSIDKIYIAVPASDHTQFVVKGVDFASEVFADALDELANLISRQSGGK